jgi:pimeloyl-ACP methyl ester carboxylesterase
MTSLLLLHGALGASAQFETWKPLLASSFEVHTPELEGHGLSPAADRPFRMEHFADNLLQYIQKHQLKKPLLFGYSMGGYVGLTLEHLHPGTFAGIFTLATKFDWRPETAAQEVKGLNADKIAEKVPAFAATLEQRHPAIGWRNVLSSTAEMMLHLGSAPTLTAEVLGGIECPVRVAVGDRDKMVSVEETTWAYRALKHGQLQVLPNTAHPLELMYANAMASLLGSFASALG